MLDSAPINAGNYKLVVKVSDETFAHTGSVEIPFTINKAALTITAENKSIAFGMNAPEFTCKADGLVDGDTLSATYSCDYTVESPLAIMLLFRPIVHLHRAARITMTSHT